ncbi:EAL domain-containing protein [Nitrosomonas sp.]|uniref:sensor domain-containing phosphodiesterase n=1 Tax=Nitrosomonas sp. TaxID=42353 RepID=UPI0025F19570|nr:EAL domain-containing protein [Nitrosomonas sp.]
MQKTKSYIATSLALISAIILAVSSFFPTELTFSFYESAALWLLLIVAILLTIGQISRTEKNIIDCSDQLQISKDRLGNEIKHRLWAEKTASENKIKSQFIDENMPVMLAYFNTEFRCRYHNRIFRRWFSLTADQIDGKLLKEFSGEEFSAAILNNSKEILAGKTIHNERILKSTKGFPYIFTEQYLPHLDNKGKTIGFYTLHTPRAQEKSRITPKHKAEKEKLNEALPAKAPDSTAKDTASIQQNDMQASSLGVSAARIAQAIEGGEFNIYCQKIAPVNSSVASSHYEILIRMHEEESNLMPPGSFLPLVDQFKMMPKLDRWIINHILQWLSTHANSDYVFYLNVAKDTLSDQTFPIFIQDQINKTKTSATNICFEIEASDAESDVRNTIHFTQKVRDIGCLVSLCSVDGNAETLELLNKIRVDCLKIDGSLICNILRDEDDLAKVQAINSLAHQANIKTIAELVETDEIIEKLKEIGIDYGQGFGIGKPHPFAELDQGNEKG